MARPVTLTSKSFLILLMSVAVCSDGIFEIRIAEFENDAGTDKDGKCCHDKDESSTPRCSGQCSTFFRICATHTSLSNFQSTEETTLQGDNSTSSNDSDAAAVVVEKTARLNIDFPCTIGMTITKVVSGNQLIPYHNQPLHFFYRYPFSWPGDVALIVEAWHNTDYDDREEGSNIGRLIARFAANKSLKPGMDDYRWQTLPLQVDDKRMVFQYRTKCERQYYGVNCTKYCSISDGPGRFTCSEDGRKTCRQGWSGKDCVIPECLKGCHPEHGYCRKPNTCRCRLGWTGERCDQCLLLPGCSHGTCNKPFDCNCIDGWDGLFCNHPTCKESCHPTRGFCKKPGECLCRIGWGGEDCSDCATLLGCVHGTCKQPLDCNCIEGWSGVFCNTPNCKDGCDAIHGHCDRPAKCKCKVGWYGENCTKCFPYPGCKHGYCNNPWECQCEYGWGGDKCDELLNYCDEKSPCKNGGSCISKSKDDGKYLCICPGGYTGKYCETEESEV